MFPLRRRPTKEWNDTIYNGKEKLFNHPLLEIVAPDISNFTISDFLSIYRKKAHNFQSTSQKNEFNSVRNLITFSIVFTYKNSMDRFDHTPPPSKLGVFYPTSKPRLKDINIFGKCRIS